MDREKFLEDHLESKEQVQVNAQEKVTDLGKFCKSHLDLIQGGNDFVRQIAEYRVDRVIAAVNSGSKRTTETHQ